MQHYFHPISRRLVLGVRLGPSAKLKSTDVFDSITGYWVKVGELVGSLSNLPDGSITIVRPNAKLSDFTWRLLLRLNDEPRLCLVNQKQAETDVWKILMPPDWRDEVWMNNTVTHLEAIKEVREFGLVAPTDLDQQIYAVTEVGRATVRHD